MQGTFNGKIKNISEETEADGGADRKVNIAKIHADGIFSQAEQSAAEAEQQVQKYLDGVIQSAEEEKSKPMPKKKTSRRRNQSAACKKCCVAAIARY